MNKKLRLLLIEGSAHEALLLVKQLRRYGYEIIHKRVASSAGLSAALAKPWDIILSDFTMPRFGGLKPLRLVRKKSLDIPFIIISDNTGEDSAVAAMKTGAHDFILKDNIKRLGPAIERELLEAENRREVLRAEQALRNAEASLLQAQQMAHLGNWYYDVKSGAAYWSDELYSICGYNPKQFVPTRDSVQDCAHPDDREPVRRAMEEAFQDFKPYDIEHRILRPDGSVRFVHTKAQASFANNSEPLGITGVVLDITERKQAEQALLAYQENLRSLTWELALAEERERRRIAVGIHDTIGQSLAFTVMQVQRLLKQAGSNQAFSKDLKEITDSLREIVKETRSMTFQLSPPVLYDIGLEVALQELTREMAGKHGIDIRFEDDSKPKTMSIDLRVLLFQCVRELLVNVAKHSRATAVKVSVERRGDTLQIKVEDNGIGFDTKIIAGEKKTEGFGLFSIRERISYIGGTLAVDSRPGCTRVTVVVPLGGVGKGL